VVLLVLSKVNRKISVSFGLVQNSKILDLAMVKVENVNSEGTYCKEFGVNLLAP
jgi:hypothetical protein